MSLKIVRAKKIFDSEYTNEALFRQVIHINFIMFRNLLGITFKNMSLRAF